MAYLYGISTIKILFASFLCRHIQEVVSLQTQQNKELQELYDRLRAIKDNKIQSSEVALPSASPPRRPRSFKSKLRSRPQSLTHVDSDATVTGKSILKVIFKNWSKISNIRKLMIMGFVCLVCSIYFLMVFVGYNCGVSFQIHGSKLVMYFLLKTIKGTGKII